LNAIEAAFTSSPVIGWPFTERALGAELGFHLGYPRGADKPETTKTALW